MKVRLLLFALYRDLAGSEEIEVDVPFGATGINAVEVLRARGGSLARLPARPVIAVNREYAPLETVLRDGDEVALLPPVAGG
jgi:molybdopterin synthase catalytic subunit